MHTELTASPAGTGHVTTEGRVVVLTLSQRVLLSLALQALCVVVQIDQVVARMRPARRRPTRRVPTQLVTITEPCMKGWMEQM